jgi:hypothetical protein
MDEGDLEILKSEIRNWTEPGSASPTSDFGFQDF